MKRVKSAYIAGDKPAASLLNERQQLVRLPNTLMEQQQQAQQRL